MIKRLGSMAIAFLLLMSLTSCSIVDTNNRFVGGNLLDDDMMSEIREEIFGSDLNNGENSETEEANTGDNEASESEEKEDMGDTSTVYWTKSGKVWHISKDCGSLKRATEIISGSVEEAKNEGKERACSRCDKTDES